MKSKIISFLILSCILLSISEVQSAERFKDDQMMKSHHNHPNLQDNNQMITVHLIPHSHDDVGWLKTVDDYYYGGDMKTQFAGVQYTIDTVVDQLTKNPSYKFSIVQVAFLYRWWNQATETQRAQMKKLVQNKQIQFINGGWCMSDQATPYYEDVVDQMTIGHRWLKQTFAIVPTIAWHIDPFGHQASSASMFSKMGIQAFFFARIDYQDKNIRLDKKSMQMIWHPLQYNGDTSNYMFTHVNYYHYSPPPGFCFDVRCTDEPIKDDPTLQDYNLNTKSDTFVNYFKSMALHFRSSNLMHTLGQDFQYINSRMWFKNIDKLIKYINDRSTQYGMKIIYSTPSDYISAIQKQGNKYPIKTDDFFPYADFQHAYWTGYLTSRTSVKGFVRQFGRWIQTYRKHISQLKISNSSSYVSQNAKAVQDAIWGLQMAQGILQHHDGVSGTSKQKVAYDYINTALRAIKQASDVYSKIKAEQISKEIGQNIQADALYFNVFWNQTAKWTGVADKLSANQTVLVNLHNPGAKGTYQIKINVPSYDLKILGVNNQAIQGDVICPNTINNPQNCQLIFNLAFEQSSNNYVKISRASPVDASAKIVELIELRIIDRSKNFSITNTASLNLNRTSYQFDLQMNGSTQTFFIAYNYYESYQSSGQKGGAYIFRPSSDVAKSFSTYKKVYYLEGTQNLVIILEGSTTLTKVYFSKKAGLLQNYGIQIQTFLTSIPVDDGIGKQVTLNFKTLYSNNKQFYTDSNGLEEQWRKINFRPTWNLTVNEAVAGNYYPINSHIRIQDSKTKKNATILTDRSIGGSVINDGQIQLLINRRLLYDDARGVDQALNEKEIINGQTVGQTQSLRHWVVFGNKYREVQKAKDQKIMITLSKSSSNGFSSTQIRQAPIKVPQTVKLYLRPFADNSYLMRLHNFDTSNGVDVQIPDGWSVSELTLNANQLWSDWQKAQYKWNEQSSQKSLIEQIKEVFQQKISLLSDFRKQRRLLITESVSATTIKLRPFDLRTFKLNKL